MPQGPGVGDWASKVGICNLQLRFGNLQCAIRMPLVGGRWEGGDEGRREHFQAICFGEGIMTANQSWLGSNVIHVVTDPPKWFSPFAKKLVSLLELKDNLYNADVLCVIESDPKRL